MGPASAVIDYILDSSAEERIRELFDLFDVDGNGRIQREELINVLELCAHEIGLEVDEYMEQIADSVFTQTGDITLEGLRDVLKQRPNLINELALAKHSEPNHTKHEAFSKCKLHADSLFDKWESLLDRLTNKYPNLNKLRWEYISNNYVKINFLLSIVFISSALYVARIVSYWDHCGFVIVARASGQCLNFFCSIIGLLVCRRSISYLRSRGFGRYLPVDNHVHFHKLVGWLILFHSLFHTLGHLLNFAVKARQPDNPITWTDYAFSTKLNIGWVHGTASITGWMLLATMLIMAFAQPYSRSCGRFELFYYTHLLFIPFWLLLFVHAPNFWKWFLGPFIIFACETIVRTRNMIRFLISNDQTTIIKGVPLPSDVLLLVIKRPPNFDYNPGDWIYILIPKIAKYEWHPFTISSAPEQEDILTIHIRAVGEWTKSLRLYFEDINLRNHLSHFIKCGQFSMSMEKFCTSVDMNSTDSAQVLAANRLKSTNTRSTTITLAAIPEHATAETEFKSCEEDLNSTNSSYARTSSTSISATNSNNNIAATNSSLSLSNSKLQKQSLKILIDGPYGSPSGQIFRSEHAVLIATGIGVTPFASILQSIVYHNEKRRQRCPSCAREFLDSRRPLVCKLRKVDFVWINRDQKSFEWFIKLLAELELSQSQLLPSERFLDIHIHLTAIEKSKIKSIGMQLALYLMHEKNKKDLVTGLRTRTKAGRPDWDEFFTNINDQNRGKVSVFFCGRPQLGKQLHRKCDKFGFMFRKEIF